MAEAEDWDWSTPGDNVITFFRLQGDGIIVTFGGLTYPTMDVNSVDERMITVPIDRFAGLQNVATTDTNWIITDIITHRNQVHRFCWGDRYFLLPTAFYIDLGLYLGKRLSLNRT